jgi:hypothetical protein
MRLQRSIRWGPGLLVVVALTTAGLLAGCQSQVTTTTTAAPPTTAAAPTTTASTAAAPATTTTTATPPTTGLPSTTTTAEPPSTTTTTTASGPTTTVLATPKGWTTFQGDGISLALPPEWKGGRAADPDTQAIIDAAEPAVPGLADLEAQMGTIDWELFMVGKRVGSELPNVLVLGQPIGPSVPLEGYMQVLQQDDPDAALKVESSESNRLVFTVHRAAIAGERTEGYQYVVLVRSGAYLYIVFYSTPKSAWAKQGPIFSKSARTIRIN